MAAAGKWGTIAIGTAAAVVTLAFQILVLPQVYNDSKIAVIGICAVLLGIVLTTATTVRALVASDGSAGVVRIAGPTLPLIYTGAALCAWLATPLLFDTLAYALHLLMLGGLIAGIVAVGAAASYAQANDETQRKRSAGRDAMLSAAQSAVRQLTSETPQEVRTAVQSTVETLTYAADRNGCPESINIEVAIVADFERLSLTRADESADIITLKEIEQQLAKRRDVLKAHK